MAETAKKAAAKKTAKKAATSNAGPEGEQEVPNPSGIKGPGSPEAAPDDEAPEYPSTTLVESESGPLAPPEDAKTQTEPRHGDAATSNDPVQAAVGGLSFAGERHEGLVDEDDNEVSGDDLFEDDDSSKTFAVVKQRVFEVFYYPNTTETAKRLLFTPGQHVNRAEADRIRKALDSAVEAKSDRESA